MTTEQQTIAVDAADLDELRRAYRAYRTALARRQEAQRAVTANARTRSLTDQAWWEHLQAGNALLAASGEWHRAAEAFCAGLEEEGQ